MMRHLSKKIEIFAGDTRSSFERVKTIDAFNKTMLRTVNSLGFTHFDICRINSEGKLDAPATAVPDSLLDTYFAESLDTDEVTNLYFANSNRSLFFSKLYRYLMSSPVEIIKQSNGVLLYELMESYGFQDSFTLPAIITANQEQLLFTLYRQDFEYDELEKLTRNSRSQIAIISSIIGETANTKTYFQQQDDGITTDLTPKQIAILEAIGKHAMTPQQTAVHIGLAESTVRTYCKHIKQKLRKKTLAGALYEAVRLGIVAVE